MPMRLEAGDNLCESMKSRVCSQNFALHLSRVIQVIYNIWSHKSYLLSKLGFENCLSTQRVDAHSEMTSSRYARPNVG